LQSFKPVDGFSQFLYALQSRVCQIWQTSTPENPRPVESHNKSDGRGGIRTMLIFIAAIFGLRSSIQRSPFRLREITVGCLPEAQRKTTWN
jgi:hypothetical protein